MNSTNLFTVHFIARPFKTTPGVAQIYARISVSRKRLELSLKKKVPIHCWEAKRGCVTGDK